MTNSRRAAVTQRHAFYTRGDHGQHASWSRHESGVPLPVLVNVDRWTQRERSILGSPAAFSVNCRSSSSLSSSSVLEVVGQCPFRLKYVLALHICRIGIWQARASRYNDGRVFVQLNSIVVCSHCSRCYRLMPCICMASRVNFVLQKCPQFSGYDHALMTHGSVEMLKCYVSRIIEICYNGVPAFNAFCFSDCQSVPCVCSLCWQWNMPVFKLAE